MRRSDTDAVGGRGGFRISRVLRSREATSKTRRSRHILQNCEAILQNVRVYVMFAVGEYGRRFTVRGTVATYTLLAVVFVFLYSDRSRGTRKNNSILFFVV